MIGSITRQNGAVQNSFFGVQHLAAVGVMLPKSRIGRCFAGGDATTV